MKNLSENIQLIIECCKENSTKSLIEEKISSIKNWDEFISLSFSHGVFPLVYHSLKEFKEIIPKDTFLEIKSTNMNIVKQNMLMSAELLKVMKLLEENQIKAISFKGPILSQMAYGDITLRQYVDLDILVDEDDLLKSIELIKTLNYKIDENILNNIFQNKSIFHDISLFGPTSVELHWRLFSDEFNIGMENIDIKENEEEVELLNHKFKSFQIEVLILYLCIHGAKHNWERIEWLLDISKLVNIKKIDWEVLIELSKKSKTEKILYSTFYLCHKILGADLPKKLEVKIEQAKILKLSKSFENLFYSRFEDSLSRKIETKNISKIQFDLLEGYKAKSLFILSLIKPTEYDYEVVKLAKSISFLYYFIRPFNLIFKRLKNKL